ncbi:Vacuolar amino acid transporter 3 [Escovopsis weberi]|uniref:Vacuolar amino acid transporter 3 n=1 Tax=Escovopsis weberi TaxID=150374 RepID=A0A0N0RUC9_ESCWE|nr:Vacuolar amino acid transporter 3 [Escovopsis weberi]
MDDFFETADAPSDLLQRERQAAILERHLPEGYSADPEVSLATDPSSCSASAGLLQTGSPGTSALRTRTTSEPVVAAAGPASQDGNDGPPPTTHDALESSLKLQGGDIHRDMFKLKARNNSIRRARTFSHHTLGSAGFTTPGNGSDLGENGQRKNSHQHPHPSPPHHHRRHSGPIIVESSFLNFIGIYGRFAGEALEDTDTEEASAADEQAAPEEEELPPERRPLLARPVRRRGSSRRPGRPGDAGVLKTFFTLMKAFIGTGILFLPKAFRNGGLLFSSFTLVCVSLISSFCFWLLLDCHAKFGGGYGELGEAIVGPRFRSLILASIALSQLGFVCSGIIFTAENLHSFLAVVGGGWSGASVPSLIALQLIALIPLALIRNISRLGPVALVADVFIFSGLIYIWAYDIGSLSRYGMERSVRLFNPSDFALTIGSAIFTFEGIGLIMPIQASMKRPHQFPSLLFLVMAIITVIFTSVGALCYATFGDETRIQVLSNFPQDSPVVNAVQLLYTLAVLVGEPVQLFPAVRILETAVFGELATGKRSLAIKWQKNVLRAIAISMCVGVALVGASDLDKFVALIGGFACVPLVYIYPAYLHYRGAARTTLAKGLDVATMMLGGVVMVFTTTVAVFQWIRGV